MKRIIPLGLLLLSLSLGGGGYAAPPVPPAAKVNILHIAIEDGRAPHTVAAACAPRGQAASPGLARQREGAPPEVQQRPEAWLYDLGTWAAARERFVQQQEPYLTLVRDLIAQADPLLEVAPFSVTQGKLLPPSGNRHDYYSLGPYWWPDPDSEDGLPYIRKDGERNPEYDHYNGVHLARMSRAVWTLSQAYFYTGREAYAEKAHSLIYTWFLDSATYMTPHLEYGQAIPGRVEGRGIGIIETANFLPVINAAGILQGAASFPASTYQGLQDWFKAYTHWLVTSEKGWDERRWHNNHGSSYDSQVASFALFVGEDSLARLILDSVKVKRIDRQIEADGSQPWELERTKSMSYSIKNLDHLIENALLAQRYGIDLWHYVSADGGSITQAIRFLIPYMLGEEPYPYEEYGGIDSKMAHFRELIWVAHLYLDDPLIDRAFEALCRHTVAPLPIGLRYPLLD